MSDKHNTAKDAKAGTGVPARESLATSSRMRSLFPRPLDVGQA